MEGTKVSVKWEGIWYPATILRQVNEEEVEIEFEDPDFPPEIVSISDTKPLNVSSNSPSIKPIAGAFNWQLFKCFSKDIIGDNDFVTPVSIQELTDLDLKSALFSAHASERKEERYGENMQELFRSIDTDQYLAFRETRRRVFCGCVRIDCTPDLKRFHSLQTEGSTSTRYIERPNLELVDIGPLRKEIEALCFRNAPDAVPFLDFDSCKLFGDVVSTQVITTTTRFVLSEDCSRVLTVIKLGESFGEWRRHHDEAGKPKKHGK